MDCNQPSAPAASGRRRHYTPPSVPSKYTLYNWPQSVGRDALFSSRPYLQRTHSLGRLTAFASASPELRRWTIPSHPPTATTTRDAANPPTFFTKSTIVRLTHAMRPPIRRVYAGGAALSAGPFLPSNPPATNSPNSPNEHVNITFQHCARCVLVNPTRPRAVLQGFPGKLILLADLSQLDCARSGVKIPLP